MSRYVDPVAVERLTMGDRVRVSPLERRAAAQRLSRRGLSARQVAELLGVSARTVVRCRSRQPVDVSQYG